MSPPPAPLESMREPGEIQPRETLGGFKVVILVGTAGGQALFRFRIGPLELPPPGEGSLSQLQMG